MRICQSPIPLFKEPLKSSNIPMPTSTYPRDLVGYGRNPPDPKWPGGARVAVQFVLNYEEGGENNILHGDPASERSCRRSSARSRGPAGAT